MESYAAHITAIIVAIIGVIPALLNNETNSQNGSSGNSPRRRSRLSHYFGLASTFGAAFFLGALIEGSNALNDDYYVTKLVAGKKIEQRQFLQDLKSRSDAILQIWNSMVNDKSMKDDKELLGVIRSTINGILDQVRMRDGGKSNENELKGRVDSLSVRNQYRFIYYVTNLTVALAHTSVQDRKNYAERALTRIQQLESFLTANTDKLGQGWLASNQIALRNLQLEITAVCLLASVEGESDKKKLNSRVEVLVNSVGDSSAEYIQQHGLTVTHPIIGQCLS